MKRYLFGLIALILFGCAPQSAAPQPQTDSAMPKLASLPDLGIAPERSEERRVGKECRL